MTTQTAGGVTTPASESTTTQRVLRVVATEGPYHTLPALLNDLRAMGGIVATDPVVHAVTSLAKQGSLHVRHKRAGSADRFTLIEATKQGRAEAGVPEPEPRSWVDRAVHATDMTEYRNHKAHAEGGPIEVIKPSPPAFGERDVAEAADEYAAAAEANASPTNSTRARFNGDGSYIAAKVDALPEGLAWDAVVALSVRRGETTISDLANAMGLSPSPTTVRIRKATALGWLTTETRPIPGKGGKGTFVSLTPDARARLGLPETVVRRQPKPRIVVDPIVIKAPVGAQTPPEAKAAIDAARVSIALANVLEPYPAILALLDEAGDLEALAARLEALGFVDEGLAVLARLDALTPAERDLLRFIRERGVAL